MVSKGKLENIFILMGSVKNQPFCSNLRGVRVHCSFSRLFARYAQVNTFRIYENLGLENDA